MRYPYDLFIRFLITRKADVNATLTSFNLPQLTEKEIQDRSDLLYANPPPSVQEYFNSNSSRVQNKDKFLEWAEIHNIRELWELQDEFQCGSKDTEQACKLFADPQKRTALSILIIRAFDYDDIAEIFKHKFDLDLSKETFRLAQLYFFNFLHMRERDYINLIRNVSPEERHALQLASSPASKDFLSHKLGRVPSLSYDTILQDIMVSSYYKFKVCLDEPLFDILAMKWATMAMKAGELKKKYGSGDKMGLMQQLELRFDFDQPEFPTLENLLTPEQEDSESD